MNKKIKVSVIFILLIGFGIFTSGGSINKISVHLNEGWNLVYGIPNIQKDYPLQEGSTITKDDIKAVYWYNPYTKEYVLFYPGEFEGISEYNGMSGNDETVYPYIMGGASWIYTSKTGDFVYEQLNSLPFKYKKLMKGWNFVGISEEMIIDINSASPEEEIDYTLSVLGGDCNIQEAHFFNSEQQEWVDFPLDEEFSNDALGHGIIIKVLNDCNMGKENSIISPPSIPS